MKETYAVIEGYEEYRVSTTGRILHVLPGGKGRFLRPYDNGDGYLQVKLRGKNVYIHRLVAKAFCAMPESNEKLETNHKDENKKNNSAENLEWVTHRQNVNSGTRNARISKTLREKSLWECAVVQYDYFGNWLGLHSSIREASEHTGISVETIRKILNSHGMKHHKKTGMRFERADIDLLKRIKAAFEFTDFEAEDAI